MTTRVLIIGGYGNFGSFIAHRLAKNSDMKLIIAGRSGVKAEALAEILRAEWDVIDIRKNCDLAFQRIGPDVVIHTSGPFQGQGYDVAKACIRYKCHYIDLADGREFVSHIGVLDKAAKEAGVLAISGASSVPCLTSAVIDRYMGDFKALKSVDYGIATAQKTARGLATTSAVLSYAGKPFKTLINGNDESVYGWQSLHLRKFSGMGWRFLGNCDIPDLELFPKRYPDLDTLRFYAGLELPFIHFGLWMMTWLVRIGLIHSLESAAPALLKLASMFDMFGGDTSGFYMRMTGIGIQGENKSLVFDLTAKDGYGPYIPCMPAIIMATRLSRNEISQRGAFPCVGFIDLDSYLQALKDFNISWTLTGAPELHSSQII
jgi:saccharopine dehydrogenase-like NADP-dependent oxidoreductase